MKIETGEEIQAEQLRDVGSQIIIATEEEAGLAVEQLLSEKDDRSIVLVVDGATVKPQQNFARYIEEHAKLYEKWEWDPKETKRFIDHENRIAVQAGLFLAILDTFIAEISAWSQSHGIEYDTGWEEKISRIVSQYPDFDMDKISWAVTALEYVKKAVQKLELHKATLVILNFDKLEHPVTGPAFNQRVAEEFTDDSYGVNKIVFISEQEK